MDTLKSQFTGKGALNNEQMQKLLKLLHEVLRECKRSEDASQVMIELLGTYTTENASQAHEDDEKYFYFDTKLAHNDVCKYLRVIPSVTQKLIV